MTIKHYFIACYLILISFYKLLGSNTSKESFAPNRKTFFLNQSKELKKFITFSFDYQPRLLNNKAPFFVNSTKGWNINYIKEVYKFKKNYTLGLNFSLSRRVEECEIRNLTETIFMETKFNFKLKLLVPHIGVIIQKKYKSIDLFGSINIGYGFDDEYSYKFHYIFNDKACDSVNFNYQQTYKFKKKFPLMIQLGCIKNLTKNLFVKCLIYNNEFSTQFIQKYYVSYCNETFTKTETLKGNNLGFNIGIGYKF